MLSDRLLSLIVSQAPSKKFAMGEGDFKSERYKLLCLKKQQMHIHREYRTTKFGKPWFLSVFLQFNFGNFCIVSLAHFSSDFVRIVFSSVRFLRMEQISTWNREDLGDEILMLL